MKVFSRSLDKVSPSEFLGFRKLVFLDLLVHHLAETLFFFFREQGWDHTNGQDVINKLQEVILSDVGISKQESSRLLQY
jgi:hypothetical protein